MTDDVWKRADFETAAINDEAAVQQAKLKADLETLLKDKSIEGATSDLLQAKIEQAQAATEAARAAKVDKTQRDAYDEAQAQALALQRQVNSDLSAAADIQAQLARTARQRNQIETANLLANQQLQRRDLQAEIDKRVSGARDPAAQQAAVADGRQRISSLADLQAAQRAQLAQSQEGPLQKFARESTDDPSEKLQANTVEAVKTFNDGLVEAIVNGKSLKDVLKNALKQFAGNALKDLLSNAEGSLLGGGGGAAGGASAFGSAAGIFGGLFHLLGFASGTSSAPGGLAIVGEHGPELANVPKGSQIMPNNGLRALLNGPKLKAGPTSLLVSVNASYDMTGNSGDTAVKGWIAEANAQTKAQTFDAVKRAMPGLQAQYTSESG